MRLKTNISSSSDVNDSYENVNNNSFGFSMVNNKAGFSTRTGFSTKTVKASGATGTCSGYSNYGIDEHGIDEHGHGIQNSSSTSLSGAMAVPQPLSPSSPTSTSEIIHEPEEEESASTSMPPRHNISSGARSSTASAAECSSFNSSSRNDGSTIGSAIASTHTTGTSNNLSRSEAATTTAKSTSLTPKTHVAPSPSIEIPRLSKDLPSFKYNLHRSERASKSPMVGLEEKSEFNQNLPVHSRSPSHSSRGSLASPSNRSISSNLIPSSTPVANSDSFSHTSASKSMNSGQSYSHSLTSPHSYHLAQNSAKSKWNVQDSNLKPIPPMHPPMPPTCTAFIDASPSMVAARIDACIKKRSLIVEYDEDAAQATVFTVERGCFAIQLYRGGKLSRAKRSILKSVKGGFVNATASANSNVHTHNRNVSNLSDIFLQESVELMSPRSTISAMSGTSGASVNAGANQSQGQSTTQSNISNSSKAIDPDFSHGVIVECMRVRGEVIPFHRHCRAILSAARGDSDGMDDLRSNKVALLHPPYGFGCKKSRASREMAVGPLCMKDVHSFKQDEVPNLIQLGNSAKLRNTTPSPQMNSTTASTFVALENIMDLLEKDRLDANVLGIKSLVLLTDQGSSGKEAAYLASLSVLDSSKDSISHSVDGRQPPRPLFRLHENIRNFAFGRFTAPKRFVSLDDDSDDEFCIITDNVTSQDAEHIVAEYNTKLRSCAMQVLTNALHNVLYHSEEFPLLPKPSCEEFMTNEFLEKIAEDLLGATRPPMASLGSANEATFAAKFIHLIAAYSERGFFFTNGAMVGSPPRPIYGLIERAHRAGSMCHRALEIESQVALTALGSKFYAD